MGTKIVFISDIHMGCDENSKSRRPYVWFNDNVPLLAKFLGELKSDTDVEKVVILGDLFDQWIVPADYPPVTSFDKICLSGVNGRVIDGLKLLASDGRLTYVPGNHDMAMDRKGISSVKDFMDDTFPGIEFICDDDLPLGKFEYADRILVAEHGNRYCLFNAPDRWTKPDASFLPLGYFISRMVAYKESKTGSGQHLLDVIIKFIGNHTAAGFIERMLDAIAGDCCPDLAGDAIQLKSVPGYDGSMTVTNIGELFSGMMSRWGKVPGAERVGAVPALAGDQGDLNTAADKVYLYPGSETKVVIFGHTHVATMWRGDFDTNSGSDNAPDPVTTPCPVIYANSGTWVDSSGSHGNYVEVEKGKDRLSVRVKEYPSNKVIGNYQGFVEV